MLQTYICAAELVTWGVGPDDKKSLKKIKLKNWFLDLEKVAS